MPSDTTREFFESDLPRKAASDVRRLFGSSGAIAFKVGADAWTFRFASAEPVVSGFDRDADLQLWFTDAAFEALLRGQLDVAQAVRSGTVKARGDLKRLEAFGFFLQRDGAALGWEVTY